MHRNTILPARTLLFHIAVPFPCGGEEGAKTMISYMKTLFITLLMVTLSFGCGEKLYPDAPASSETGSDNNTGGDGDADADSDSDTDADTDTDTDADTDVDSDTDADTDTDTDVDSDSDADGDRDGSPAEDDDAASCGCHTAGKSSFGPFLQYLLVVF